MSYKFIIFIGRIYTKLLSRKFYHFGQNSIIKPVLNSANEKFISIGDNVNIGAFCRITVSTEFGGYKCQSVNPVRIKIGDHVDVGNNSFISANNFIEIGNNVIMSSYVFITDHEHGFQDVTKSIHEQPLSEGGRVKIGDNVFLGEKCSILKNVSIGEHSVIGSNSVVTKDVPAYSVAVGNPAHVIKQYDFNLKQWIKK
jgi:acetyltransferase-like isoleucine patch superfamily enzyme